MPSREAESDSNVCMAARRCFLHQQALMHETSDTGVCHDETHRLKRNGTCKAMVNNRRSAIIKETALPLLSSS
jgi:hypothetical protein